MNLFKWEQRNWPIYLPFHKEWQLRRLNRNHRLFLITSVWLCITTTTPTCDGAWLWNKQRNIQFWSPFIADDRNFLAPLASKGLNSCDAENRRSISDHILFCQQHLILTRQALKQSWLNKTIRRTLLELLYQPLFIKIFQRTGRFPPHFKHLL